jgi:iron complex transport system ATP-binding protein
MQIQVSIHDAGYNQSSIIKDIHFTVKEGELLTVIGPNGSGKTTLIRAISNVLSYVNGQIMVNGTNLLKISEKERARMISVVPQSTYVPPSFLVREVVLMGRTPYMSWNGKSSSEDLKILDQVMHQTFVKEFENRFCGELSAGERQRVILARALAQKTPVLLMDEPTSHLDLHYQIEFFSLVKHLILHQGKTVLVAVHDLNLAARFGDLCLALKNGKTAAFGNTDEVLGADTLSIIYEHPISVHAIPGKEHNFVSPS